MTLTDAVEFCREIEPTLARIGYHCGLTGSCLYKGESSKDMDIIIYPHNVNATKPESEIMDALGVNGVTKAFNEPASTADKLVWVGRTKNTRVDFFFLT